MKWHFRLWVSAFLGSVIAVPASAEEGISGVLQFAEQYHAKENKVKNQTVESVVGASSGKVQPLFLTTPSPGGAERSSEKALISTAELKRRLALREREVSQLKKENGRLRSQSAVSTSVKAVVLSEPRLSMNAQLKVAQSEHKQALDTLAEQAALARHSLESQVLSLTQKVGALEAANTTLQRANQQDADRLKFASKQYQPLKVESAEPKVRQTYAAGVMLGRDVLVMQQAQALLGLDPDNRVLLAGLHDALNNQVQLNSEALQSALTAAEEGAQKARLAVAMQQKKVGETYLAKFKQGKGIKQDPLGFWYHIEYLGDGEDIKDGESVVDVVVIETLTDGTVVEDMDARGRVISQPLNMYPVLFRAALTQLKNHGSMTLVVPSTLAYGDEGYPPKVPPGATLVYTLRVEQVKANLQPSDAKKSIPEQKAKPAKSEVTDAD